MTDLREEEILAPKTFDDLVFENRNKSYGGYFIRSRYKRDMILAFVISSGVALGVLVFFFIMSIVNREPEVTVVVKKKERDIKKVEKKKEEKKKEQKTIKYELPKIQMDRFVPPKVVAQAKKEEEIKKIEDMTNPGTKNDSGTVKQTIDLPPDIPTESTPNPDEEFVGLPTKKAQFPGGFAAMQKFIADNINYRILEEADLPNGKITITLKMLVNKEGKLSEIELLKGGDVNLEKEVMRVVKMMPAWEPSENNGVKVKNRIVVPIRLNQTN